LNSFISWIGGKNYLKRTIAHHIPENIQSYIEVFGGAAWVLFYKDQWAEKEIYNDFNGDLANLFRCVKYHGQELQRELSWVLNAREFFDAFKEQLHAPGLTDIQRAARFYYIIKLSYGSNIRSFAAKRRDILSMYEYLRQIEKRLSTVIIENKDFADLIQTYDAEGTVFYLDPPYYGAERYYQVEFTEEDHHRLLHYLKELKGKFLLSYNDSDVIREMYREFPIESVSRQHNLVSRYKEADKVFRELLIRNY
jgi:DNA adenine methylase